MIGRSVRDATFSRDIGDADVFRWGDLPCRGLRQVPSSAQFTRHRAPNGRRTEMKVPTDRDVGQAVLAGFVHAENSIGFAHARIYALSER